MQAFVEFNEAAGCKKEEADKDLPFTPDAKKVKPSTAGKYGSAYSTVRNLARQAMQKQTTKKAVKEEAEDTLDEDMIIEKTTDRQKLRDALDRHTEHAIAANKRGDDEAVKVHQGYINKIKTKMAKLVQNEEVEQIDELKKSTLASYVKKAGRSAANAARASGVAGQQADVHGMIDADKKSWKRHAGIAQAVDKLAKEETELEESAEHKAAAEVHHNLLHGVMKHGTSAMTHNIKAIMKQHGATDYDKVKDIVRKKGYAGKFDEEVELQEASDSHKVMVTVSDPNHPAVSQRKEQIMKHVIVRAGDKGEAQAKAESFYKKKGYKVHGSEYHSKQPATSMKTEETQLDELDKSTLASYAKKSVAELPKHQMNATYKATGPIAAAHAGKHPKTGESPIEWDNRKIKNRAAGVTRAVDKLTKEETDMKTFTQFMEEIKDLEESSADVNEISEEQLDEYETKNGRYVHKGSYGSSYQPEDDEDEDEPKKKPAPTGEKRGRGRPKGSTSGARQQGSGKSKSYGGLAIHSLSLPNTRK